MFIELHQQHLQRDIPRRPRVHNLPGSINGRGLNWNQLVNNVLHPENVHILSKPIHNTDFKKKLIQRHEIISSFAAFGRLSVENDDFFEIFLGEDFVLEFQ